MDDVDKLVDTLTSGVHVSGDSFSSQATAGHPHFSNYKNRGLAAERQARRRQEFLEAQKTKRSVALALVRHLDGDGADETNMDAENESASSDTCDGIEMEPDGGNQAAETSASSAGSTKGYRRRRLHDNPFQDQLMCSEWLVHVPDNMADEWIMVPCPEGRRMLVIGTNGSTRAYAKSGRLVKEFSSALPGDFKNYKGSKTTVLDCVFCEEKSTFYCLDVISWNGCPVYDSDAEFRFFWLKTKLEEVPALSETSNANRFAFQYMTRCPCDREGMERLMQTKFPFKLDGVLFFHKRTQYVAGQTPLVGWLKPFMLPEMLGVEVPSEYMIGYEGTSSTKFIADFDTEYEKKHCGRQYGGKKRDECKTETTTTEHGPMDG